MTMDVGFCLEALEQALGHLAAAIRWQPDAAYAYRLVGRIYAARQAWPQAAEALHLQATLAAEPRGSIWQIAGERDRPARRGKWPYAGGLQALITLPGAAPEPEVAGFESSRACLEVPCRGGCQATPPARSGRGRTGRAG